MSSFVERAPRRQRIVHHRIIIKGELVLTSPTHLGNGDSEGATDMTLLRDSRSEKALLTGASIAGALRSYLHTIERGHGTDEPHESAFARKGRAELLFGGRKGDDDGYQSPLVIADAVSIAAPYIELRDGVRIEGATRTPANKGKYDLELLAAGTRFPLQFELALTDPPRADSIDKSEYAACLVDGLIIALQGLASGSIGIGMKKRRGFGRCKVDEWRVWHFDMSDPAQLVQWLAFDRGFGKDYTAVESSIDVLSQQFLLASSLAIATQDQRLVLEATFALEGSILIRAGQDEAVEGPDVYHLHARQADGQSKPVISGTALAGVLRHQTVRIANTLQPGSGEPFAARLFGSVRQSQRKTGVSGQASRLLVHESVIEDAITDLVQNRVSIDRFTGGALDGALFSEQPVFARKETSVTIRLELIQPEPAEQAMLLLLLKDLWTGMLVIGGESSVGRGRLSGRSACIKQGTLTVAELRANGKGVMLTDGDRGELNRWVREELPVALTALVKEDVHA